MLCTLQCSDPYVTVSADGVATLVCESDLDGDGVSDSQVRGRVGVVKGVMVGVVKDVMMGVVKGV